MPSISDRAYWYPLRLPLDVNSPACLVHPRHRATLPLLFIPISQHEVLPPVHPSNLPRILEDALVIGLDNAGQTTLLKPDGAPFIAIHTCVSAEKRYATLLEARFKWRRGSRRKGKTVEEAQWQAAESLFSAGCQRLTEALSMC
jgi:hypothetical protein